MAAAISISPLNPTIVFGESVNFVSVVTGSIGNLTYQWKKGGVAIDGETDATLVHTPTGVGADVITCYITSDGGNATSNASTVTIKSVYETIASTNSYLAKIAAAI